jgi:hypothetical protein
MPQFVQIRIRRIAREEAYVSVPIDDAVLGPPAPDGGRRLNGKAVFERALALGTESGVVWAEDGAPEIVVHPVQTMKPSGPNSN